MLILIGFFLRKYRLSKAFQKGLSALIMDLLLPCNILASFISAPQESLTGKILEIFLVSLVFSLIAFFLSKILYLRFSLDKKPSLQYSTTGSNFGLLGTSITEGLYGSTGVLLASFYMIPARIIVWTLGITAYCKSEKKNHLKNLLNPCVVSVIVGSVLYFTGLHTPTLISDTLFALGKCNFAMAMLSIGMQIEAFDLHDFWDRQILYYSFIRLLIMPTITFAVCRLFNACPETTGIAVLLSAMPAPPGSALLAEKYNTNATFAIKCITVSTAYSILTIPICCMAIRYL